MPPQRATTRSATSRAGTWNRCWPWPTRPRTTRSPVILGFSGIYLPHPGRLVRRSACQPMRRWDWTCAATSTVPCCLLFNESPVPGLGAAVGRPGLQPRRCMRRGRDHGGADRARPADGGACARSRARRSRRRWPQSRACRGGLEHAADGRQRSRALTDPQAAAAFVERTGIDALAVSIGQVHLHGREQVRLDLARLAELRDAVPCHSCCTARPRCAGTTWRGPPPSVFAKINVGSVIKRGVLRGPARRLPIAAGDRYTPVRCHRLRLCLGRAHRRPRGHAGAWSKR